MAIIATAEAGILLAVPGGEDPPLLIQVDVADNAQPEQFAVAVRDEIEFVSRAPDLPAGETLGDVVLRIRGDNGVLGDVAVMRRAAFSGGNLQLVNGGGRTAISRP